MMAEATVEPPVGQISQYFCHPCGVPINPVLPEYTCPTCQGGFVELLSPEEEDRASSPTVRQPTDSTDGSNEQRRVPPPDPQAAPQILEMLQFLMNAAPEEGPIRQRTSGGATNGGTPGRDQRPNLHVHMPRTSITFQNVGNQPIALMDLFNSLPGMTGGGGNFMFPLFNLHGNPQDYVWGEGGLDTIITQLLNNVEGQGPPPADKDDIDSLKTVKVTAGDISAGASHECPVCKDDFKVDDEVKKLPCKHIFHPNCVTTWLHMHNTCPVCRRPIGETNNTAPPQFGL